MASEDFFVFLSVVFKKFGLVFNEFLPVVDCLFHYSHNLWLLGIPNDRFGIKKVFSFFTLTPSQIWLKRPVYRGFKGEGKCEGRAFTLTPALTLHSHFRHRKVYCQGFYLQNLTKVPEKYSYLVPTVQHRYTTSIDMLHFRCKGAAPLVPGCCAFTGTIILKVFTPFFLFVDRQYQRRIKSSFFILLQQDLSMRV